MGISGLVLVSVDVNRCSLASESCVWGPVGAKWCPDSIRKTLFVCSAFKFSKECVTENGVFFVIYN